MSLRALYFLLSLFLPCEVGAQQSTLWYASSSDSRRWLYPGQRDSTTPFVQRANEPYRLELVPLALSTGLAGTRVVYRGDDLGPARDLAQLVVRVDGAIGDLETTPLARQIQRLTSEAGVEPEAWNFGAAEELFYLLPALLRAPTTREPKTTSVALMATGARNARELTGRFVSRWVRDTVVNGETLQLLRDEGDVAWRTVVTSRERTLAGPRKDVRNMHGTWIVTRTYDPQLERTIAWSDRLHLEGDERDTLPDGRALHTPLQFDMVRRMRLADSSTLVREMLARSLAARESRRPPAPTFNVNSRTAIDSIVKVYRSAPHEATRDSIEHYFAPNGPTPRPPEFAEYYWEIGDTARAVRTVALEGSHPLSASGYAILRPMLDDPARALRFGLSMNDAYEKFEFAFNNYPPSQAPDSTKSFCVPWLCIQIEGERTEAHEPRLRDLGVIASASRDPARWGDTLIALARNGHSLMVGLAARLSGRTVRSDSLPEMPLPSASASWREWVRWMYGDVRGNPLQQRMREPFAFGFRSPGALQTAMKYRGGPYWRIIEGRFRAATLDTARFVYGRLLQGMGMRRSADALSAAIRRGSSLDVLLAQDEAWQLPFATADSSTVRAIQRQLLDRLLDHPTQKRHPWREVRSAHTLAIDAPSVSAWHVRYVEGNLTDESRSRLSAAGIAHVDVASSYGRRDGAVMRLSEIEQAGPFARLSVRMGPTEWSYLLFRTGREWRLLEIVMGDE